MCKVIGYDPCIELLGPGIHLGTSWTVRIAMLMYKEEGGKKKNSDMSLKIKRELASRS